MKLKSPKAKKKLPTVLTWKKMLRTPVLLLLLLGSINCDSDSDVDTDIEMSNSTHRLNNFKLRHRHAPVQPNKNDSLVKNKQILSEIRYLRRHLNKKMVNFVMTDVLVDGEIENRIHYNGVTAKETFVGADGSGLKLRQLTDGRHLVQVIYTPNGVLQDCEYINEPKSARNFIKTLRKELKLALDEESSRILDKKPRQNAEEERYYRHFENVTFRILKNGEKLPTDVASWFNYDRLKTECFERHEEMTFMMENRNKVSENSLQRSRRSLRENFIVPGTKWCGAGQLAEAYNELGPDRDEDRCCRSHDNCRMNIGAFKRRFGHFNFSPFTISHCRCDRRFRACLKLADTSVSNMVGKVFFNIVQTKCFILKKVKMCTHRSWWGKCLARDRVQQAFLRDNLPY